MEENPKIHPARAKADELDRFFTVIGEITIQFSIVDYMLTTLLSVIINYKAHEMGDFVLHQIGAQTGKKRELLLKIVNVEPVKIMLSDKLRNDICELAADFKPTLENRNKIIHGLGNISTDNKGWPKTLNLLKYNKKEYGYRNIETFDRKKLKELRDKLFDFRFELVDLHGRCINEMSEYFEYSKINEED